MTAYNFTKSGLLTAAILLTACAPKPPALNNELLPKSSLPSDNMTAPDNSAPLPPTSDTLVTKSTDKTEDTETSVTDATDKTQSKTVASKTGSAKTDATKTEDKTKKGTKAETATTASAVSGKAARVSSWDISGAMAAKSRNKAWSASINWLQQGAGRYQIRLFGPLGSGTVMIQKNGGVVTFKDGPKSASSGNADKLLMQQTGVRLPVGNLYYWVRGIPAPGSVQSVSKDKGQHIQVLRQAGYTIQYTGYTRVGGIDLPSQIRLQGNGVFIKLVIKRWKI